jgi:4-amino-4-deoxy-L-arabinose transferase-like glycosyltransferase
MSRHENQKKEAFVWIGLAVVVLLALFVRSYDIENIPAGIYPDEAVNAADALHANETDDYRLFYENNQGREGLFINLQALALKTMGISVFALKFWSMVFGTLTVLGMYLLAKELWQKPLVALGTAYLTATSYWAVNFSRIGFRAIMAPFLLTFTFYFFIKALRTKSKWLFALSGFTFGLGLHTYIAFRLAPLIFVVFLAGLILSYKDFLKIYWKHALAFILGAFVAAAPMFWDFYRYPEHFISRSAHVSIFSPEINHGDFWGTLAKTVSLSLIKYNFVGDQNWRHNYPPYPVLDPISGLLFLAGFIYLIPRTVRLLVRRFKHQDRNKELSICFLFLGWLFVMLMPEFLTDEGLPHALRAIGTIPVVFLIASMPLLWVGEKLKSLQPGMKVAALSLVAITLVGAGAINLAKYFVYFAHNPHQYASFNANFKNMATYLLSLPPQTNKYLYTNQGGILRENDLPIAAQPIAFLTYGRLENMRYIKPDTMQSVTIQAPAKIVLMDHDQSFVDHVQKQYPRATFETVDLQPGYGSEFTVMIVP